MSHACRLWSLGLSDDSILTRIMVFIISLFLSSPHAYCLSCYLLLGKICISIYQQLIPVSKIHHMLRFRVQNIVSLVQPFLALLLLKLLKFKGKNSHIHHDPHPNGPMGHGMASQLSTITKSQQPRHQSALIPQNRATAVDDTANQRPRSFSSMPLPHTLLRNKNQNPSNESQPSIALTKSTSTIILLSLPKFRFQSPGINPLPLPPNAIANSKKEEWGCKKHRRKD